MEKLKFKLVIAYDGTGYQGWQAQKSGIGIQQKVEEALSRLFPSVKRVHASSRTDTGVHAMGLAAHVEVAREEFKMPVARLALALNAFLPGDIRILSAARVNPTFHARFQASGKQYRYTVWNHHAMNPLLKNRAWHFPTGLDVSRMRAAALHFLGRHDFRCFAGTRNYEMDSNVRTLTRCDIRKTGPMLTFILEGDGFLYKMCRGIVGTLVQVGQGRIPLERVPAILASRDRREAGMTAPAHGLVLWKVYYHAATAKKRWKDSTAQGPLEEG